MQLQFQFDLVNESRKIRIDTPTVSSQLKKSEKEPQR